MASRSTRVTIRNQTGATLRHIDDSLEHGIWTEPWRPPAEISPGSTMSWWSESDGVATGTEGHARYAVIGSDDIVTFHWNNPFVGANFYEQSVTGPFGIYFSGGTGNNTEVVYSLIPDARVSVRGYLPSTHGFAFPNHWPAEHITSITMPDPFGDILIGNAAWGLCGGMSFASRDYFESGMWAPEQATNPSGEGDPLFDYIVRRLAQSLNGGDVADFLKYADPVYPDTDDPTLGNGRDWVMAHVAFPAIRDVIDSGHPCPIGLVLKQLPSLAGLGHQVCVYAYRLTGQELVLWVYDPNSPGKDNITMFMDISRTDQALIDVKGTVSVPEHPICFFTQGYEQRDPVQPRQPAKPIKVPSPGGPNLIQGNWGQVGNYELLVPQGDRLVHYARLNDPGPAQFSWIKVRELSFAGVSRGPGTFQRGSTPVAVSFLQTTFRGDHVHGNFDAVIRVTPPGGGGDILEFAALDSAVNQWNRHPLLIDGQPIRGVTGF